MCDEQTINDWEKYLKNKPVSRRKFNALTAGASLAAALPSIANAQRLTNGPVQIRTPDGIADCYMAHPPDGSYPGIIMWTDILGLRPAFMEMGLRLAARGYAVLVPNPFYRSAAAPVVSEGASFQDQDVREKVLPMAGELSAETHVTDANAFVDYLDRHGAVNSNRSIGTLGYCMGGPMVMRTASARPDRIGAAAIFHGGGLATDADNSPHRQISEMNAQFLIAIAENDDANDPQAKNTLRETFDASGLNAEIEVYSGAQHGWTVTDSRAYLEGQAEQAWSRLLALLQDALD
jgi:carboxymethylenebutenolidase